MSTPDSQVPEVLALLDQDRLQANAVVDRLRFAWRVDTDAALAECLHTSRQTVSKWRSRNSIPYQEAVLTAEEMGLSLDWLLRGDRAINGSMPQALGLTDIQLLYAIFQHLVKVGYISVKEGPEDQILKFISKSVGEVFLRARKTVELLQSENHMSEAEAVRVAAATVSIIGPAKRK